MARRRTAAAERKVKKEDIWKSVRHWAAHCSAQAAFMGNNDLGKNFMGKNNDLGKSQLVLPSAWSHLQLFFFLIKLDRISYDRIEQRVFTGLNNLGNSFSQSCEMSKLLHGANLPNQILPQEKRVNCNKRLLLGNKSWLSYHVLLVLRHNFTFERIVILDLVSKCSRECKKCGKNLKEPSCMI